MEPHSIHEENEAISEPQITDIKAYRKKATPPEESPKPDPPDKYDGAEVNATILRLTDFLKKKNLEVQKQNSLETTKRRAKIEKYLAHENFEVYVFTKGAKYQKRI